MPLRRAVSAICALSLLLVFAVPNASASWPMFQHDLQHTGRTTVIGAQQAGVKWTFQAPLDPTGSPVVGPDGTIYAPAGQIGQQAGALYAVDPVTGTQDWAFTLPGPPVSTPAVADDGTIYVHAYGLGNIAAVEHLVAINPDGTQKWDVTHFNGGSAVLVRQRQGSPVIAGDGKIWVGSRDGGLYNLNPADGSVACSVFAGGIESTPAIAPDGTVYVVGGAGELSAFNSDCTPEWDFALEAFELERSPAVASDGTIWVGDGDNSGNDSLVGVNPTGTEKCRLAVSGNITSTPAIGADGTVYVGAHHLYAVDPSDCSQTWRFPTTTETLDGSASPIVDGDGTIYWRGRFSSDPFATDAELYAVDSDGTLKWSTSVARGGVDMDPSGVIAAAATLYQLDRGPTGFGGVAGASTRLRALADITPPAVPTITDTDPDSPSPNNKPKVKGTAEAGSTVSIYTTLDCTGSPVTEGMAASFASPGLTVNVADDSSTTFHATATDPSGNTSACSTGLTYVEDSTPPDAPTITDTDPDSPANNRRPRVKGTVGGGDPTQVVIYKSSNCLASTKAITGTVAQFTGAGIRTTVPEDATTQLSARTVDAAGNKSVCSNSIAYVEDSTPPDPATITDTDPDSPANDRRPEVKGTVGGGDPTQVVIYKSSSCLASTKAVTGTVAQFTGAGITVTVPVSATTQLSARTLDAVGNKSICSNSISYTELP